MLSTLEQGQARKTSQKDHPRDGSCDDGQGAQPVECPETALSGQRKAWVCSSSENCLQVEPYFAEHS